MDFKGGQQGFNVGNEQIKLNKVEIEDFKNFLGTIKSRHSTCSLTQFDKNSHCLTFFVLDKPSLGYFFLSVKNKHYKDRKSSQE